MKERTVALVWALAVAACGGEAEIGNNRCMGDNLRCDADLPEEAQPIVGALDVAVSPESLTKVRPASSLAPIGEDTLDSYELAADSAGTLWEFAVQVSDPSATYPRGENRLRFRATALEGNLRQGSVEPPENAGPDARAQHWRPARKSELGPMVDVGWFQSTCSGESYCRVGETLAFGPDPDVSPERSPWGKDENREWSSFAMGRWIDVYGYRVVEQRNSSRKLIWRQSALDVAGFLTTGNIELLDRGELLLLAVSGVEERKTDVADELWRFGFDGNVKQRLALSAQLAHPQLTSDTRDHALLAGVTSDGSIQVVRQEPRTITRTWSFLRTQYNELPVLAISVDLADTVYVLTATGGREEKDRVPVLCRVRADDRSDCLLLEKPAEVTKPLQQLQATGPGIVYVGDTQRLFRYELPNE